MNGYICQSCHQFVPYYGTGHVCSGQTYSAGAGGPNLNPVEQKLDKIIELLEKLVPSNPLSKG
jgi:hypothetical protein